MRSLEEGPEVGSSPPGLREEVLRAGLGLFAAYGVRFAQIPFEEDGAGDRSILPPVLFLGICGFGGGAVAGHVILGATEGVLTRSNTTRSTSDDWMAELANQFLGRIKNGLLRQGIQVHRVPPVVLKGAAVALAHNQDEAPLALTDGRDRVLIWLDSEPSTDDASVVLEPPTDVLHEGEMVMF